MLVEDAQHRTNGHKLFLLKVFNILTK